MSILLEALRKSEKSRQLGQTPTLETPVDHSAGGNGTSVNLAPLLLVVISAIVMGWFGWQQFERPIPVDTTSESAAAVERPQQAASETAPAQRQGRTLTETFEADGPAEEAPAQTSGRGDEVQAVPDIDEQRRQRVRQSFDQYVAEDEAEPGPLPEDNEATELEQTPDEALASRRDQEIALREKRNRRLEPATPEPISYWALPQGVRDNLPEIKITVLVYAEAPEDRFLLSNGQRLVEKDEVDGGLVLQEIRRDGAVFTYRKYRFLVKS